MNIKSFNELVERDYNKAGGKGASLAKMAKEGFNVPEGYVICSDVFEAFIKDNNLNDEIEILLAKCDINDEVQLENLSNKISSLINNGKISEKIQQEILIKFKDLDTKYVAVRSSATAEDGHNSAWAGQLETYLYTKEDILIENIKKCWASLFSTRALFYRIKNNIKEKISMAVVVQRMINSDLSGVAFSLDPVENKNNYIIEAVYGLGEAIVSGSVKPDKYIVDSSDFRIKDVQTNIQTRKLMIGNDERTNWINLLDGNIIKLDERQIIRIAEAIRKIKEFYGFDVDIEWTIENDILYILQCRPITKVNNNMDLFIDEILKGNDWNLYVRRKFHWLLESSQIIAGGEEEQNKYLGFNLALYNYLILNGDEYYTESEDKKNKKILSDLYNSNSNFFEEYKKILFKIVEDTMNYVQELEQLDFSKLSNDELLKEYIEFKNNYIKSVVPTYARPDFYIEEAFKNLLKENLKITEEERENIFNRISTCSNEFGALFYSEEPLDLLKIALEKHQGNDINQVLEQHIKKYSWLKAPVKDKLTSFTKEDYLERIENIIETGNIQEKIDKIFNARNENDNTYKIVINEYNIEGQTLYFSKILRDFIFLRTYMTEHTDYLFYTGRITILDEICKRANIINQDLVMLSLDEIENLVKNNYIFDISFKQLIEERRIGYAIIWTDGKIGTFFGKDAVELQAKIGNILVPNDDADKTIIKGNIANKGKVIGIARILNSYDDINKIKKGDIIVATMTTPDYISAMEKAIGFITDEGGITCHAAIVSREFGIPCIVGTNNATKIIKDGQKIELDAYNGMVKILE